MALGTGIPRFIVLHVTVFYNMFCFLCVCFYQLKVCDPPELNKPVSTILLTFLSLFHILVILTVFQIFFMVSFERDRANRGWLVRIKQPSP